MYVIGTKHLWNFCRYFLKCNLELSAHLNLPGIYCCGRRSYAFAAQKRMRSSRYSLSKQPKMVFPQVKRFVMATTFLALIINQFSRRNAFDLIVKVRLTARVYHILHGHKCLAIFHKFIYLSPLRYETSKTNPANDINVVFD